MNRYIDQDDPPPPYSLSQYSRQFSPLLDQDYYPSRPDNSKPPSAGRYEHEKVFMMHRLQILRQQYTNSRDHVSSLREEVLKQRRRTEQTLQGTYQYLKVGFSYTNLLISGVGRIEKIILGVIRIYTFN
jgi:hypothetical protein